MRYAIFLFMCLVGSFFAYCQVPEGIQYQAVARDPGGNLIANRQIAFRISFLLNGPSGSVVYSETHSVTSNEFGLIDLNLGKGSAVTGSFANIDWAAGLHFVEVAIDPQGGSSFTVIGTSQLLSVPYALYAKKAANGFSGNFIDLANKPTKLSDFENDTGFISSDTEVIQHLSNEQRDALVNAPNGLVIYNTSTGCLNLKNSISWFELCGNCLPQPSVANAGVDQADLFGQATLNANIPTIGQGAWSKVSGSGGEFGNTSLPNTTFTGVPGQTYTLRWTISNHCGSRSDDVLISFASNEPSIGALYGGGIVFYKFPGGGGLIAALSDQSSGAPWGCSGTAIGGLTSGIGTGSANTDRIVSQCSEIGIAAKICSDLNLGSYIDWYLPSVNEMYEMTQVLTTTQLGVTNGHQYWTSNENNDQVAPYVTINGPGLSQPKSTLLRVRAIRTFAPVGE